MEEIPPPEYTLPAMHEQVPASLRTAGILRRYTPGSLLFLQGAPAERAYLIATGEVSVTIIGRGGAEAEVARFSAGDWIGEAIVLAGADYPSQARALTEVEALSFSRPVLETLAANDKDCAAYLLHLLARKCVALNRRILELGIMPARERLLRYLLAKAAPGQGPRLVLDRPKRDIAALLGIVPETFSRILRQLEDQGLISVSGPHVDILKPDILGAELESLD
jgi:CRP/FNR family transcriptional regulator